MDVKTYRASTMQEALSLVRRDLGPDAAVLHTREVQTTRLFGLVRGSRLIEVTASATVNVPSRLPPKSRNTYSPPGEQFQKGVAGPATAPPPHSPEAAPARRPERGPAPPDVDVQSQLSHLQRVVGELCRRAQSGNRSEWPEGLFQLFTRLLDAEMPEDFARGVIDRLRGQCLAADLDNPVVLGARVVRMLEEEIRVAGPIRVEPGRRRLVALVGPTGVGKTTTIAKLAANFRLREKRRVGLITVDTYRIAAVEQLRTYAEIIDLPMQVVSTPREMRDAAARMNGLDLVLLDTAGRSPRDDASLRELEGFLAEAAADEVHLVLSSVTGAKTLLATASQFAALGTTAIVLTKLDEASGLGHVLPVLRSSGLPLSYLTTGQKVPDDIETADARRLARMVLEEPGGSSRPEAAATRRG